MTVTPASTTLPHLLQPEQQSDWWNVFYRATCLPTPGALNFVITGNNETPSGLKLICPVILEAGDTMKSSTSPSVFAAGDRLYVLKEVGDTLPSELIEAKDFRILIPHFAPHPITKQQHVAAMSWVTMTQKTCEEDECCGGSSHKDARWHLNGNVVASVSRSYGPGDDNDAAVRSVKLEKAVVRPWFNKDGKEVVSRIQEQADRFLRSADSRSMDGVLSRTGPLTPHFLSVLSQMLVQCLTAEACSHHSNEPVLEIVAPEDTEAKKDSLELHPQAPAAVGNQISYGKRRILPNMSDISALRRQIEELFAVTPCYFCELDRHRSRHCSGANYARGDDDDSIMSKTEYIERRTERSLLQG
jgi:hypothetical protein